ncbi:MAG TPA: hypothetical protein VF132_08185 [Rudaea sp.]
MSFSHRSIACLTVAVALALAACSRDSAPPAAVQKPPPPAKVATRAPPAVAPAPAPGPAANAPAPVQRPPVSTHVNAVALGSALGPRNRIAMPTRSFGRGDTIYAVVSTTSSGPTPDDMTARWIYQNNQVVHESTQKVPHGLTMNEFHISKPDGWPAGNYKIELLINDVPVQNVDFEVK